MKLTDKKIIEALKAGKEIKNSCGDICRMVNGKVTNKNTCGILLASIANLTDDFEIIEPEINWDKVIREKYLCKFWDEDEEPAVQECKFAFLEKYTQLCYAPFRNHYGDAYQYCRPLRAEEVKLATDEKEFWK